MEIDEQRSDCQKSQLVSLVQAAKRGRRQAFGQLVKLYQQRVQAIALRRLRDQAEAQELCQEVFMQALSKLHQLRDPQRFGGWLRTIAVRMAINRGSRRGPTIPAAPGELEARCVEHETPLGRALAREREDQLRAGLGRLRSLDRETLVAFYFQGHSILEMSDEFDSPVGTIKRRLHVARNRLAKELEAMAPA